MPQHPQGEKLTGFPLAAVWVAIIVVPPALCLLGCWLLLDAVGLAR